MVDIPIDKDLDNYIDLTNNWIMGKDLSKFGLNPTQIRFVTLNGLLFSTAYIGMVRCYCGHRTVWQTSFSNVILKALNKSSEPNQGFHIRSNKEIYEECLSDYSTLALRVCEFVSKLMTLSEEELQQFLNNSHVGLFSN